MEQQAEEQRLADPEGSKVVEINSSGTVATVASSTPGYAGTIGNEFNTVPYYCQGDSRWGTIQYGNKKTGEVCKESNGSPSTMTTSACGPTSMSMVINYWAKKEIGRAHV